MGESISQITLIILAQIHGAVNMPSIRLIIILTAIIAVAYAVGK